MAVVRDPNGRFVAAKESATAKLSTRERELTEELRRADDSLDLYQERLAELELQLEDWGWQRLNSEARREFSRAGLRIIADLCRIYSVKNPLIKHAIDIQRDYVFGQGISIVAKDPEVNELIQAFLDDPKNKVELTTHQAIGLKETTLQVEANLFFVLFTSPTTGRVRIRSIPFDEINDIITDPNDRKSVRFYERTWTLSTFDFTAGAYTPQAMHSFYPDWQYTPDENDLAAHPTTIGNGEVHWDQPVFHVKVGGLDSMRFGVPEVYAGLDWAKAVKQDLEDYATVKRALTRFATLLTTKAGPKAVAAAKAKLNTTYGGDPQNLALDSNPSAVTGSMFIAAMGNKLEPIRTAGAQPDTNDAHGLWLMAATALGIPITMLSGDADAGNYATAKTLDRPTELKFTNRQRLWHDVLLEIFRYAILQSLEAPAGVLAGWGSVAYDEEGVPKILPAVDADGEPRSLDIDIHFPDVVEHDPETKIKALVDAATLAGNSWANLLPPKPWLQKLMQLLGFEQVDEWMARLYPEGSDELELPAAALAAQQAAADQALALKAAAPAPVAGKPGARAQEAGLAVAAAAFQELRTALQPIIERRRREQDPAAAVLEEQRRQDELDEKRDDRSVLSKGFDTLREVGRAIAGRPTVIEKGAIELHTTVEAARAADIHMTVPERKTDVHVVVQPATAPDVHIDNHVAPAEVTVEHHDRGPTRITRTVTKSDHETGEPRESVEDREYDRPGEL